MRTAHPPTLTPRREIFAEAIGRGARVVDAARAAGYSRQHGSLLLRDPAVRERVAIARTAYQAELAARAADRADAAVCAVPCRWCGRNP